MKRNICALVVASTLTLFTATACAPIIDRHGFVADDGNDIQIAVGTDNKDSIIRRYGNPSQTGMFDDQVWYYISSTQSQVAFFKTKTTERKIVAISFEDNDSVAAVRNYALQDGRIVDYDKRHTPTRGREVTFLEQIFGSVGRNTVTLPGQDPNLPTAAGGPRAQ